MNTKADIQERIYFDNAASTKLDSNVLEAMMPYLTEHFGNPSSTHAHGRFLRAAIEKSRQSIAKHLKALPAEIFFTSGGTESDNAAIRCTLTGYQIKHVITSPAEHKAVIHTLKELEEKGDVKLNLVKIDKKGHVDLAHLEELLANNPRSFVSLMHGNNEVATILKLKEVGELCKQYDALFHCDTVQTMGHFPIDLSKIHVHFITGSAHKLHGPKGTGFLFVRKGTKVPAYVTGGSQERGMRGGTENVMGIVGLAKALEIAHQGMEEHAQYIRKIKAYFIEKLQASFPDIIFNGDSADVANSLYTVLSVCFPASPMSSLLLFTLDLKGVSASGGSACSSGSNLGSHVLAALNANPELPVVRFSFSKNNTFEEVDKVVEILNEIYQTEKA
jgi:cysteine desulfurase